MRCRGFSLIELMVTITILAILVAIGLPSFQGSLRSNRVATATNELVASLALARSEAIRSPMGAGMCASEDGESCGGNWNDGWLVWVESDTDGEPGDDERILRYIEGRGKLAITEQGVDTGAGAAAHKILFDSRGLVNDHGRTIVVQPVDCPDGHQLVRELTLSAIGQARVAKDECS